MKKILMTALVLVAGASLFTASAASKKKVKKAATLVELKSSADSLSYVAGMNATRGLIPYIQQSFQVDTAYMENFLRGYKDALAMGINPKTVAYSAGMEVAKLVEKRVYPGTKEELKSTGDSISHAMFQNGLSQLWLMILHSLPLRLLPISRRKLWLVPARSSLLLMPRNLV